MSGNFQAESFKLVVFGENHAQFLLHFINSVTTQIFLGERYLPAEGKGNILLLEGYANGSKVTAGMLSRDIVPAQKSLFKAVKGLTQEGTALAWAYKEIFASDAWEVKGWENRSEKTHAYGEYLTKTASLRDLSAQAAISLQQDILGVARLTAAEKTLLESKCDEANNEIAALDAAARTQALGS